MPICVAISIPSLYIWLNVLQPVDQIYQEQYKISCYIMAVSCILELCAEVPTLLCRIFCFVKLKIIIDTARIVIRSIIFIMIIWNNKQIAVFAFGVSQLCSVFTIIIGYNLFFHIYMKKLKEYRNDSKTVDESTLVSKYGDKFSNMEDFTFNSVLEFFPLVLENNSTTFDLDLQILVKSFLKQGICKHILTEGEKYVMSFSPALTMSEQATYDIVNNIGSLAARFILRPIEDSSYFYFTQTLSRNTGLENQNTLKVQEAGDFLSKLFRTVSFVGLMAVVFGQSYSRTLLELYGGSDFIQDSLPETLLRLHCLVICLMSINGISEGYMNATNTSSQIDSYNYFMASFSAVFVLLSYQLTVWFGSVGLIFANFFNMLLRVLYSSNYIRNHFKLTSLQPLNGYIPTTYFTLVLFQSGIICKLSETYFIHSPISHIGVGVVCVAVVLIIWALENRDIVQIGISKYKKRQHAD